MKRLESTLIALSRATIASAFWIATRLAHDIQVHGLEYDTRTPRTYLGMSHKRDLDPIILLPTIVFHRGWRGLAGNIHFALRGDAFSPGYLARITMRPRWFSHLVRPLSLGTALHWLGTHPTDALLRPAEEWIRELMDTGENGLVGDELAPFFIEEVAQASGEGYEQIAAYRLSSLLAWRYQEVLQHYYGPELLIGPDRRPLERRAVARIKGYLVDLAEWLWQGGSLYGSPEGQLSPDGRLSPINSGLHRMLRAGPPDTRIVPIFLIYDFMTVQRPRVFIDFAPAIENAPELPADELDNQLRAAWLHSARFTCTQLASGFLMQALRIGQPSFTQHDLADYVCKQAAALHAAGRHVDEQLLDPRKAHKRVAGYLEYAARHHLVRRDGHTWIPTAVETPIKVRPREVGYDQFPLMYAWNELQEMLSISSAGMRGLD